MGAHMKGYDFIMIGHISKDIMIDYSGNEERITGGAVVYSSAAAAQSSAAVIAVSKAAAEDSGLFEPLRNPKIEWVVIASPLTTSIRNTYHTADKEKREVLLLQQADPFSLEELPQVPADIYYFAGLFKGEIPETLIWPLSRKGKIALDAQGVLRCSEGGSLVFEDWKEKHQFLPMIHYFKVDAAEAEILTGISNREAAALRLCEWGAGEVVLTHNTEIIVCDGSSLYRAPYTNKNNSGRTGRGDTSFASYLAWRKEHNIAESVSYAAALCSIKMESPGPFRGTIDDVYARMRETPRF